MRTGDITRSLAALLATTGLSLVGLSLTSGPALAEETAPEIVCVYEPDGTGGEVLADPDCVGPIEDGGDGSDGSGYEDPCYFEDGTETGACEYDDPCYLEDGTETGACEYDDPSLEDCNHLNDDATVCYDQLDNDHSCYFEPDPEGGQGYYVCATPTSGEDGGQGEESCGEVCSTAGGAGGNTDDTTGARESDSDAEGQEVAVPTAVDAGIGGAPTPGDPAGGDSPARIVIGLAGALAAALGTLLLIAHRRRQTA